MVPKLGNSGAPRWYDCDQQRFAEYLALLESCGANACEVVLHDGDADDFTSRVHVLRSDWDAVIHGYRDAGMSVYVHGPLTAEFSPLRWLEDPRATMNRYEPILQQVAEIASDQEGTTLVLHGVSGARTGLTANEQATADFVLTISDWVRRWSDHVQVVIELRAFRAERPDAAATSRESVQRIVALADDPNIGICWDVAHDLEGFIALEKPWTMPDSRFLDQVRHLHLHDIGHDGEPHCPPLVGRVPLREAVSLPPEIPSIMEVRWRMAERMGNPWEILAECYRRMHPAQ